MKLETNQEMTTLNDMPEQIIPARIVIGVTGHRTIENPVLLKAAIQSVLPKIQQMAPALKNTPVVLSVLSPLAEGADRIIAQEVLKIPGAMLEVILPMEKAVYIQDFKTDASKKEFEELIDRARNVRTLSAKESRTVAYEGAGRYIVEQCDVLIALWDGKPAAGRGGTQEIVQYARESHCPLVWINPDNYSQIQFETIQGLDPRPYHDLDDYNRKRINAEEYRTRLNHQIKFFSDHAKQARLPLDQINPVLTYLLRHYVRADKLALNYQRNNYRSETLMYAMALAAIIIAAFQVLFFPERPLILISEVALMLGVLVILWICKRRLWHEKWIDYRVLAERLRSALFMAMAGVDVAILKPPRHLSLSYSPKDWIVAAFSSVWCMKPKMMPLFSSFEGVKQFLLEAWLEDQLKYHDKTSQRYHNKHQFMTVSTYFLFGLTIAAAIFHMVNLGNHVVEYAFSFLAVIFPAIAASISAIKTQRDYLRVSLRSKEMMRHLLELKDRLSRTANPDEFYDIIKETEYTMLHENEDWRVVVRFHKTEIPV
jgi:hypothetical protein